MSANSTIEDNSSIGTVIILLILFSHVNVHFQPHEQTEQRQSVMQSRCDRCVRVCFHLKFYSIKCQYGSVPCVFAIIETT